MSVTTQTFDIDSHEGKFITISYKFTDKDGAVLGDSQISGPFTFCVGAGDAIPGLEPHIVGLEVGMTHEFVIHAEDAYGAYNPVLSKEIPRSAFPESIALKEGIQLYINQERVTVSKISEDTVTVDSNHPLAGVDLYFNASVLSIDEESPIESHDCGCGGCSCKNE